VQLVALTL